MDAHLRVWVIYGFGYGEKSEGDYCFCTICVDMYDRMRAVYVSIRKSHFDN